MTVEAQADITRSQRFRAKVKQFPEFLLSDQGFVLLCFVAIHIAFIRSFRWTFYLILGMIYESKYPSSSELVYIMVQSVFIILMIGLVKYRPAIAMRLPRNMAWIWVPILVGYKLYNFLFLQHGLIHDVHLANLLYLEKNAFVVIGFGAFFFDLKRVDFFRNALWKWPVAILGWLEKKLSSKHGMMCLFGGLGLAAFIFHLPFLLHHKAMIAASHGDDSLYAWLNLSQNSDNYINDIFYYVKNVQIRATIMNWGSIWLIENLHIPKWLIYHLLLIWMEFGLAMLYVIFGRREKWYSNSQLIVLFAVTIASWFYRWNLATYGVQLIPYAAYMAVPFLWWGMMEITRERNRGYLLLTIGVLFHPSMAIYSMVFVGFYLLLKNGPWRVVSFIPLLLPSAVVLASVFLLLGSEFPHVSPEDIVNCLLFNFHANSIDNGWTLYKEQPVWTLCLMLLLWISRPHWHKLGHNYAMLISASIIGTILLSLSHLIGLWLEIPFLMKLIGLRSPTLLAVVALPMIVHFLLHLLSDRRFEIVLFGATVLVCIAFQEFLPPLPIFVLAFLMSVKSLEEIHSGERWSKRPLLMIVSAIYILGWLAIWTLTSANYRFGFTQYLPGFATQFSAFFSGQYKLVFLVLMILAALLYVKASRIDKFNWRPDMPKAVLMFVILGSLIAYINTTIFNWSIVSRQEYKDLYDAQIWANQNTKSNAVFLVAGDGWRNYSNRPRVWPHPIYYYGYLSDQRIKTPDDKILHFFGIDDRYNKELKRAGRDRMVKNAYLALTETGLVSLAKLLGAEYLVERRELKLKKAYSNRTINVYLLETNLETKEK